MIKKFMKEVHNLEDLLVECSEMAHFNAGINSLLTYKNEAYLEEKKAEENRAEIDICACEIYSYLSTT